MTPLECVELQLAAYNERNLDLFLTAFAETVRCYRLPDMVLTIDGKAAMSEFYATNRFVHEGLHAKVLNRMVIGNKVIDHELIHGLGPEPMETSVIFVVEDGLIAQVFFLPAKSAN